MADQALLYIQRGLDTPFHREMVTRIVIVVVVVVVGVSPPRRLAAVHWLFERDIACRHYSTIIVLYTSTYFVGLFTGWVCRYDFYRLLASSQPIPRFVLLIFLMSAPKYLGERSEPARR